MPLSFFLMVGFACHLQLFRINPAIYMRSHCFRMTWAKDIEKKIEIFFWKGKMRSNFRIKRNRVQTGTVHPIWKVGEGCGKTNGTRVR